MEMVSDLLELFLFKCFNYNHIIFYGLFDYLLITIIPFSGHARDTAARPVPNEELATKVGRESLLDFTHTFKI